MTEDLGDKIKFNPYGGWLILVQIILFLLIFSRLSDFQTFWGLLGEEDKLLKTPGITDAHMYTEFLYVELITSSVLLLWAIGLVYLFFKRMKLFPMLMVIFIITDQLSDVIIYFLFRPKGSADPFVLQKMIFGMIVGVLMILYLVLSKRVKLTFTK